MAVALIAFAVVFAGVFGAYWLFVLLPEQREQAALLRRLKSEDEKQVRVRLLKNVDAMSHIALFDRLLTKYSEIVAPIKKRLDDSGVPLTVAMFILLSLSSAFVGMLTAMYYTDRWWLALPAGVVGAFLPTVVVNQLKTRRVRQFEEQFPEAVELIARALRAGHGFATGLQMVAEELPAPAGPEFRLLYDRQNYGAQLPDALKSFAARIPSIDARFFVTAVLTQREAGGNLSEVLDRLAAVMRERFRIKREVRVRSAHGRITAFVLAAMPPVLAGLMFMNSRDQFEILTTDPLGIRMLIAGVVLETIGFLCVRKLVDIQY